MKLFDEVEEIDEDIVYRVKKSKLSDAGIKQEEMCSAKVIIENLMDRFEEKNRELKVLYDEINALATNCKSDAESQLMLMGMDRVLSYLEEVMSDVFDE